MKLEYYKGWQYFRILFCVVSLFSLYSKFLRIPYVYCDTCMRLSSSIFKLNEFYQINFAQAYILYLPNALMLILAIFSRKRFRFYLFFWFVSNYIIFSSIGFNIKAYDRLQLFLGLMLLISPPVDSIKEGYAHAGARKLLLLLFAYIYLYTGISKVFFSNGWLDGSALSYILNHRWHAGGQIALWFSTKDLLMFIFSIFTVLFEIMVPFLLFIKKLNPLALFLGIIFHLQIEFLMHVGYFSYFMLCAYPLLIEPEFLKKIDNRLKIITSKFPTFS